MDFDGGKPVNLTNDPAVDAEPAWSADGTRIAFSSRRTGNSELFVMALDGSELQQLTNNPGSDAQPSWSPDGQKIAFTRSLGGNKEIFVMNADGTGEINITNHASADSEPAWSPAGDRIAFTSRRRGSDDIFVVRPDGSSVKRLTLDPASDSQASWAPAGEWIAFSTDRDGNREIYVMTSKGSGQTNLTNNPGADTEPALAPEEGYRLIFNTDRDGDGEIYVTWNAGTGREQFNLTNSSASMDAAPHWQPLVASPPSGSPIEHVVIIFMENQSFDAVLGRLCLQDDRCDAVSEGQISTGETIPLRDATDIVPPVGHSWFAQTAGINGGLMNGFDQILGCGPEFEYACYQQFDPEQIPSLAELARTFVISDRTFETDAAGSWGAHTLLASPHQNGFYQAGHHKGQIPGDYTTGWGCDSGKDGPWGPTWFEYFGDHYPEPPLDSDYPTCTPMQDGSGPYRPSAVPWTQTIMNRLDGAGVSWNIFAPGFDDGAYGWSICPTFADCLYTDQSSKHVEPELFPEVARNGTMPHVSWVIPRASNSQHNGKSMMAGDNWIAEQVSAVMEGPDWESTAIFITWDDCGCFYDHVPPPPGKGIREPMVIVSPYARPGYTDSRVATFASMQAFIEHTFGLAPLAVEDAYSYDFSQSFDFDQAPLPPVRLEQHPLEPWVVEWLKYHPHTPEFT